MDQPVAHYWSLRLKNLAGRLESNNFEVFIVDRGTDAAPLVLEELMPVLRPQSVSWGGSLTFIASGLHEQLLQRKDIEVLDTFDKSLPEEAFLERRRKSLLCDLYITGTNAVTEDGRLVNLDMIGNRVAALTFGPRNVVVLVGRNKIVADLDEALYRVKNYAAPVNAMRLDKKTPCVKTSTCQECQSPDRICNTWTITEKAFPKGRVKVVLINEEAGF
jgi:hypothetical protein